MTRTYFTTKEVAEILKPEGGVGTVRQWIREGRLVAVNIGQKRRPIYRVSEAELVRFGEANSTAA